MRILLLHCEPATAQLLSAAGEVEVVSAPALIDDLHSLLEQVRPGVVLIGEARDTEGEADLALVADACAGTRAPVMVRARCRRADCAMRALRAGARAYLLPTDTPETVLHAARLAHLGELYVSDAVRPLLLQRLAASIRGHAVPAVVATHGGDRCAS